MASAFATHKQGYEQESLEGINVLQPHKYKYRTQDWKGPPGSESNPLLLQANQSYNSIHKQIHLKTSQVVFPHYSYQKAVPVPHCSDCQKPYFQPIFIHGQFVPLVLVPTLSCSLNNSFPSLLCILHMYLQTTIITDLCN